MKKTLSLISLSIFVWITSCESKKHEEHKQDEYLATNPLIKDTSYIKKYVCQIKAIQHIELRAIEKGYLEKIFVDEGQLIKKGQHMFKILPIMYQAEMQIAKAEAAFAEIEYENTLTLYKKNVVSKNQLALAKAKKDKAKAQLDLAKAHLGFTDIYAPFEGVMDRFRVREGSLLEEGHLLTSLSNNSKIWVYFNVPEAEYLDYKSNIMDKDRYLKVDLIMANDKKFEHSGIVETIEADFNNETGNIAFRATFSNPKRLLRHGETGTILITKKLEKVMLIPQKATFEILDKKYVYIIDENNKLKTKVIKIGADLPDLFVVTKGLKTTDKILLEGLRKVRNGDKIKYKFEDPKKVISRLKLHAE